MSDGDGISTVVRLATGEFNSCTSEPTTFSKRPILSWTLSDWDGGEVLTAEVVAAAYVQPLASPRRVQFSHGLFRSHRTLYDVGRVSHSVHKNRDNFSPPLLRQREDGEFTFACDMDNRTTGASLFAGAVWLDTLQTYPQPRKEK